MQNNYNDNVFVNCPFDPDYKPIFWAIIYTIYRCGFKPKSALEEDDSSDNRIDKIIRIIESCRYGIHDISRTELDKHTQLPRFNMPYELSLFWGAKKFGGDQQKRKVALVLEKDKFSYQKYLSDINGVDPKAHNNDYKKAITHVRNWLQTSSRRIIPGDITVIKSFDDFINDKLPRMLHIGGLDMGNLTFNNCLFVEEALKIELGQK